MENKNKENDFTRVNIRVSSTVKGFFDKKKLEMGISKSAMMALALEEYVSQNSKLDSKIGKKA